MEHDRITAKIEVLDNNICNRCQLLKVTNYPTELWGDNTVVAFENHYRCENMFQCKYLRTLFRSADKTTPKVEEAESDP